MGKKVIPRTLKGFRDFLPLEKKKRDFVLRKLIEVAEKFGFEPIETPTLEYASLLLGKYGEEADKLVYRFQDRGEREIALRYDQTVPTARVLAQYGNGLPKYFRRYQTQNVFRADKPQKGRYREFTQFDIDIFNSRSSLADAEIIACTYFSFKKVGYPSVIATINDRQILFDNLKLYSSDNISIFSIIQTIDKLDKINEDNVVKELIGKGMDKDGAKNALKQIKTAKISENLQKIIDYSQKLGIPEKAINYSPTLARGLDYYTGMIFEIQVPEYTVGSLGGGGRYDNLIEQLSGFSVPAVGIAYGFDRMVDAADLLGLIVDDSLNTNVLVTVFAENLVPKSLEIAAELRKNQIKTEVFPAFEKLDKQLKYADKKQIPYVVIIGEEEVKKGLVTVKNLKTGEQKTATQAELVKLVNGV